MLAPIGTLVSEIQVLDDDRTSAVPLGEREQLSNCLTNVAIARRCRQTIEREWDRLRRADWVPGRIHAAFAS
jgi:hypothetical protein